MEKIISDLIFALFFLAGGVSLLVYYFMAKNKSNNILLETGQMTEAIVFNLDSDPSNDSDSSTLYDKVTIRFLTKKDEWITTEIRQSLAVFYTGQYKVGDRVELYYDKSNPENIYVTTKQSEANSSLIMIGVSIILLIVGLYLLIKEQQ